MSNMTLQVFICVNIKHTAKNNMKKLKPDTLQEIAFYIFVPSTAIAIFSDYWLFETISLIAAVIFTTILIIEYK